MRTLLALAALATLAQAPAAQTLTDLQPGRNFPSALVAFGTGRSENIDVGDIDRDGDYDVLVANGGDGTPQDNKLYVNSGGLQGGTLGVFLDESITRLANVATDTSRDGEFADLDNDHDLDIYISNRGSTANGGEVSRAYANQGGLQLGTIGFFAEVTDSFWGTLVSVPAGDQVFGGDQGPWRDFTCDCDFTDLDDDGDLDLFHSSYGPNINGARDSRIFLNDGTGTFHELWPWANTGADIQTHTLDMDLVDLDGDLDHDVVMSSRNSQARVYRNNFAQTGWTSGDRFTDVTQTALIDTGATVSGGSNYEGEVGDLDGDGDFDVWMKNYSGVADRLLRNNGDLTFTMFSTWHRGDPSVDENEVDFLDFDSDGDLDAFSANFSGTNWIYQGGIAQGLTAAQGLYHRTGFSGGGNLATWPETPSSNNGGTTLDGECADLDMDGDPDILLANDGNQQNRAWPNFLGVPDTHAPTFHYRTIQGDTTGDDPTVVHVQLRDNAPFYIVDYYEGDVVYSVDGGPETCVQMFAQRGQQFRGTIPATNGTIAYRFEATDDAGNTGVSPTVVYTHSGVTTETAWQNLDCGTPGLYGIPYLEIRGNQIGLESQLVQLRDARPSSIFLLWIATPVSNPLAALGGTVYAFPFAEQFLLATDSGGTFTVQVPWPAGFPSGIKHWWQCLIADASNPFGIALSNAVEGTTP